jgi:hypothetical protein
MDAQNGGLEAQNEALEDLYRPVVADFHHFKEKLGPDPHLSQKLVPDPHKSKKQNLDQH